MYTAVKLNDRGLYIKNHSEISVDRARYLFSQVAKTPDRGRGGPGFKTGKRTFFSDYLVCPLLHTQEAVVVSSDGADGNKQKLGECYNELRKVFGVLGNYSHTSFLNVATFNPTYARDNGKLQFSTPGALSLKSFFCAAYGFEGFAKTASESGINVTVRALPVTCEIDRTPIGNAAGTLDGAGVGQDANGNIRYDIWAMTDLILYITMDGQMSTRI